MSGYNFKIKPLKPEMKDTLVGCKRCRKTWYEERLNFGTSINSAHYDFDCCDDCITENDHDQIQEPMSPERAVEC